MSPGRTKTSFALRLVIVLSASAIFAGNAVASPLSVPFDFSRRAIGIDVMVNKHPLYMLLDTGVDPSVIDLATAGRLGLTLDRKAVGQASGEGSGKSEAIPSSIKNLQIGGHAFGDVNALAADMKPTSVVYGKPLNGVLGYSFLKDKAVLIDYPAHTVTFYSAKDAAPSLARCRTHYAAPLRFFGDENFPLMPELRFGSLNIPATLDTGSNRFIGLYKAAYQIPTLNDFLAVTGHTKGAGFRGSFESQTAKLKVPVRIGPFELPVGVTVASLSGEGSVKDHVANVGNETFAALKLKILLDYRAGQMTFYGNCAAP